MKKSIIVGVLLVHADDPYKKLLAACHDLNQYVAEKGFKDVSDADLINEVCQGFPHIETVLPNPYTVPLECARVNQLPRQDRGRSASRPDRMGPSPARASASAGSAVIRARFLPCN
jgi:hypothetical protein